MRLLLFFRVAEDGRTDQPKEFTRMPRLARTAAYEATGNFAVAMNATGHTDARTAMRYQHPALDSVPRSHRPEKSASQ
jgi:hypothetical protein